MQSYEELVARLQQAETRSAAWQELDQELRRNNTMSAFLAVASQLLDSELEQQVQNRLRVFFLRSWTLEQVVPVLRVKSLAMGVRLECRVGQFNQYQQEILNPASELYQQNPNVVVLAVRLADLAPELLDDFPTRSKEGVQAAVDRVLRTMEQLLGSLRQHTSAAVLVHNFEVPATPAAGILDYQQAEGQAETIRGLNRALAKLCQATPSVHVLDYDAIASRCGKAHWVDPRMFYMAAIAVNPQFLPHLADEYLRYLVHLAGRTRKCLVLDLDNTLWGGVIGEDGLHGIRLGADYPGAIYRDFQRAILQLQRRGVILALCSKNNPEDALEVLDRHPHMVLRREHFVAMRINWQDKATNIRELARELNIGLDSMVFLDDNPVEIAHVRQGAPGVLAYQLPATAEHYTPFLTGLPVFDVLALTDEDRRRSEEYRNQAVRRSLEESSHSLEEFYQKLEMRAVLAPATEANLPRIAQLTQKTNQFNLTTQRYTEREIAARVAEGAWQVYGLELEDRFGKNGLVAVGILRPVGQEMWVDTFLMSCRVMSRTVEDTFLHYLAMEAARQGYKQLIGEYVPSGKNQVVANFYHDRGFKLIEQSEARSLWALSLANLSLEPSPFVRCEQVA